MLCALCKAARQWFSFQVAGQQSCYSLAWLMCAVRHYVISACCPCQSVHSAESMPPPSMHANCIQTTKACAHNLQHETSETKGFPKYRVRGPAACRHLRLQSSRTGAVSSILLMGGDTDTNAAIVGGMVGALQGADSIPDSMKALVLGRSSDSPGIPRPAFLTTEALPTICQQQHRLAQHSNP